MKAIPQCSPHGNYLAHRDAIDAAMKQVLDKGQYILGENVTAFEHEFAAYIGGGNAVGVASGTDALTIALRAIGIGAGDEVITVSHTAVATVAAIELAGAVPVLVDIDKKTYTIDASRIEAAITSKTKVVVAVHLYGRPAAMNEVLSVARAHNLVVVEDCAQAHGAMYRGKRVGSLGDIAAFSFYPTKNLGAIGDGGMIVTGNATFAQEARLIREYGWRQRYVSDRPGTNSRLDELQAAILRVKLESLDRENEARRAIARVYDAVLGPLGIAPVPAGSGDSHVYHQYVIIVDKRDSVRELLAQKGIGTAVHYPVPVHWQPAYRRCRCAGAMTITELAATRILSLPMFPELRVEDAAFVADFLFALLR
jgi:dTDP-4-amino-4,6-dideoxygalactose transaminase